MIMGGGPAGKQNKTDAVDNVDIVDCKGANPHFAPASSHSILPRLHLNSVLPGSHCVCDRRIAETRRSAPGQVDTGDLPSGRERQHPNGRLHRTTAVSFNGVLLPDARVVTAGGNPEGGTHVQWDQDPEEEMRLEIFQPSYLFRGERPAITLHPRVDLRPVRWTIKIADRREQCDV